MRYEKSIITRIELLSVIINFWEALKKRVLSMVSFLIPSLLQLREIAGSFNRVIKRLYYNRHQVMPFLNTGKQSRDNYLKGITLVRGAVQYKAPVPHLFTDNFSNEINSIITPDDMGNSEEQELQFDQTDEKSGVYLLHRASAQKVTIDVLCFNSLLPDFDGSSDFPGDYWFELNTSINNTSSEVYSIQTS